MFSQQVINLGQSSDCGPFGQEKPTSVYTKFQLQQPILLQQIMQWAVSDSVLLPLFLLLLWVPPTPPPPPRSSFLDFMQCWCFVIDFYLKPFWWEKWSIIFISSFFYFSNVFYLCTSYHLCLYIIMLFCNVLSLSLTWNFILISFALSHLENVILESI